MNRLVRYFSKILYILGVKRWTLLFIISLFLITSSLEAFGIGLIGPFIALATNQNIILENNWTRFFYQILNLNSQFQFICFFGVLVVSVLYLKSVLGFFIQKYIFDFGFGQQAELRFRLMHSYLRVPYTFHLTRNTAVSVQNLINETQIFANGILMPILFCISNFIVILALTILLLITDFGVTSCILFLLLTLFFILIQFKGWLSRWGQEAYESNVELIRIIGHGLGGLKETRIYGCESYFEDQLAVQAQKFRMAAGAYNAFTLVPRYVLEPFLITFLVAFTIIYLRTGQSAHSLAGTLGVFGMASVRLLPAASSLMQAWSGIKNSSYVIDKLSYDLSQLKLEQSNEAFTVRSLKQHDSTINSEINTTERMPFINEVVVDRISYRYPNSANLTLNSISLRIRKGESIGLIGKSGSGKTTLVDVVLGLLTPESGGIEVDGVSINSNLRKWQNLIGYIPQSIFLMDDTIEHNVAIGIPDEQIDRQKLKQAIQAAQLSDLVKELPNGLNTVIGERGIRLSGGQRQRIGIARALYHECEILVLDEATAALDYETENLVTDAINSLSGIKTIVIIAHRLSTIEHCDRLYLLDKGQIVKSGSYQEVVCSESVMGSEA